MCKRFNIRAAQQSSATDSSACVCYRNDSSLPFTHVIDYKFVCQVCVCVCVGLCTFVCRLVILRQFLKFYSLQCQSVSFLLDSQSCPDEAVALAAGEMQTGRNNGLASVLLYRPPDWGSVQTLLRGKYTRPR